jgi:hypothetical protein
LKQILIGKNKNLIFSLKLAFWSVTLLAASLGSSFAATGDILYQNCASEGSCTGAGSNDGWTRTVVSSGCRSGSCLKLVGTLNTNPNARGYGAGNTAFGATGVSGKKEITVSHWVKTSATSIKEANFKFTRLYVGSSSYTASEIAPSPSSDLYTGSMIGTLRPAPWFKMVTYDNNIGYPKDNGDGTYYSHNGYIAGNFQSGSPTWTGPTWVKWTKWVRLPSTLTASDGACKIWIGDQLVLDIYNFKYKDLNSGLAFTKLTWYPSSEAAVPFEHWEDEMIVYEGYVPPGGAGTPSPAPDKDIPPSTPVDFKKE